MVDSILKYNLGVTRDDLATLEKATAVAKGLKIELMKSWELGHVITAIFEETVEHMLLQPTFITEYPAAVSPLARRNDQNPDVTDRFRVLHRRPQAGQRLLRAERCGRSGRALPGPG